jgi:hypothetical protein
MNILNSAPKLSDRMPLEKKENKKKFFFFFFCIIDFDYIFMFFSNGPFVLVAITNDIFLGLGDIRLGGF